MRGRLRTQRRDADIQRNRWNVAFRTDLFRRFFRRESRFDAVYGLETAFDRIQSQHLAQSGKGQLDHLTSGYGHRAQWVHLHHHVMNPLALRHRSGDRQLLVFRPAAGFRGGFLFLPLGRACQRWVRQTGNVRAQGLDARKFRPVPIRLQQGGKHVGHAQRDFGNRSCRGLVLQRQHVFELVG